MPYRHLTLEERRTLFRLLNAKVPVAEIANQLGRHRSTVHREISRNRFRDVKEYRGYFPITADDSAKRRRQRRRKPIRDARLRQHVTEMLARWWSPEQIAGRLWRSTAISSAPGGCAGAAPAASPADRRSRSSGRSASGPPGSAGARRSGTGRLTR